VRTRVVLRRILRNISGQDAREILVSPAGDRLITNATRGRILKSARPGAELLWDDSSLNESKANGQLQLPIIDLTRRRSRFLSISRGHVTSSRTFLLASDRSVVRETIDCGREHDYPVHLYRDLPSGNLSWCDDFTSADLSAKSLSWRILSRSSRAPRCRQIREIWIMHACGIMQGLSIDDDKRIWNGRYIMWSGRWNLWDDGMWKRRRLEYSLRYLSTVRKDGQSTLVFNYLHGIHVSLRVKRNSCKDDSYRVSSVKTKRSRISKKSTRYLKNIIIAIVFVIFNLNHVTMSSELHDIIVKPTTV